MLIQNDYLNIFSKFFNRKPLLELIYQKQPQYITDALHYSGLYSKCLGLTYGSLFEKIYNALKDYYKCEYVYKNEIFINEIIKSRHKGDALLINEFNTGDSKVDLLILNGTTTAYEIKTEIDTINRLEKQLNSYVKVFDIVNVLTHSTKQDSVITIIKSNKDFKNVGVYRFNDRFKLETIKESKSNIRSLNKEQMLNALNQSEIEKYRPDFSYKKYKDYFLSLTNKQAHNEFKNIIEKKVNNFEFIKHLSPCLKMAGYRLRSLNNRERNKLVKRLNDNVR